MTNIKNVVQYGITWGYGRNIKSVVSTLKCWTKGPPQLISSVSEVQLFSETREGVGG